MKVKVTAQG